MPPVLNMPERFVCCLDTSLHHLCEKTSLMRQPGAVEEHSYQRRHQPSVVSLPGSSSFCWWLNEARMSQSQA